MDELSLFAPSLLGAAILSGVLLMTGRLAFLDRPDNSFLDLASGIAIAYVFVDILPHLAGKQRRLSGVLDSAFFQYLDHHVYVVALAGFCAYLGIELSMARPRAAPLSKVRHIANQPVMAWFVAFSVWMYGFYIGYMLAEQPTHSYEPSLLFALAVSAHFIGLNHVFWNRRPEMYDGVNRHLFAVAPLAGCLAGVFTELSDASFAVGFAWLAGGVISSAMSLELPRIRLKRQFVVFCAGAAGFTLLVLLLENVR